MYNPHSDHFSRLVNAVKHKILFNLFIFCVLFCDIKLKIMVNGTCTYVCID